MTATTMAVPNETTANVASAAASQTIASPADGRRSLTLRIPIDELSRYAGLTAAVSAVLAIAGILATGAYLSAWNVPAPLVRLDPLTAALRSETVLYQFALLAVTLFGLSALDRLAARRPIAGRLLGGLVIGLLVLLAAQSVMGGFAGPAATVAGGLLLYGLHRAGRMGDRATRVAFAIVALIGAFQTGADSGRLIRDDPAFRTLLGVSLRAPVVGLDGGREAGGAYHYEDLYLVFRDGEALYVARDGDGSRVWIIPAAHLLAVGVSGPEVLP